MSNQADVPIDIAFGHNTTSGLYYLGNDPASCGLLQVKSLAIESDIRASVDNGDPPIDNREPEDEKLLATVVRFVLHARHTRGKPHGFRGCTGHGTVMAGRYLITHNHFPHIDLTELTAENNQGASGFTLYDAAGKTLVRDAAVGTFYPIAQTGQMTVLDFGPDFFADLGVASAEVLIIDDQAIAAGAEVAQVDWDGERSYLIRTTVAEVIRQPEGSYLLLNNYVMQGASGGGVFWQGFHIGNNWSDIVVTRGETDQFVRAYSLVTLNQNFGVAPNAREELPALTPNELTDRDDGSVNQPTGPQNGLRLFANPAGFLALMILTALFLLIIRLSRHKEQVSTA